MRPMSPLQSDYSRSALCQVIGTRSASMCGPRVGLTLAEPRAVLPDTDVASLIIKGSCDRLAVLGRRPSSCAPGASGGRRLALDPGEGKLFTTPKPTRSPRRASAGAAHACSRAAFFRSQWLATRSPVVLLNWSQGRHAICLGDVGLHRRNATECRCGWRRDGRLVFTAEASRQADDIDQRVVFVSQDVLNIAAKPGGTDLVRGAGICRGGGCRVRPTIMATGQHRYGPWGELLDTLAPGRPLSRPGCRCASRAGMGVSGGQRAL